MKHNWQLIFYVFTALNYTHAAYGMHYFKKTSQLKTVNRATPTLKNPPVSLSLRLEQYIFNRSKKIPQKQIAKTSWFSNPFKTQPSKPTLLGSVEFLKM